MPGRRDDPMKVLVFDLDDTLYEELSYVRSGFQAVAAAMEDRFGINREEAFQLMWDRLKYGRGKIFDEMLQHYRLYSKTLVQKCIGIYRHHEPDIKLHHSADRCLDRFRDYPIYIVTDGHKIVQHRKLLALGLYNRVKFCYITHRYGIKHAKPSPYCFLHIVRKEKIVPNDVVYIADNPYKDFVGIKPFGFRTIRIMQGNYKHVEMPLSYEAEHRIFSLDELDRYLV